MVDINFEPEIRFPADPYQAGKMYLAVIAYPEIGAGQPGAPGFNFAAALGKLLMWSFSKSCGLRNLRKRMDDPKYTPPQKREFAGELDRGWSRIYRRISAYDMYGTQLVNGFFSVTALAAKAVKQGRPEDAYYINASGKYSAIRQELWEQGMPSVQGLMSRDQLYWTDKFELNHTGVPADPAQKIKDDYRRAFLPSVPVMHLVHGLVECISDHGPKIADWDDREPLSAMLLNSEIWIEDAIKRAERWRAIPHMPGSCVSTDKLIRILR